MAALSRNVAVRGNVFKSNLSSYVLHVLAATIVSRAKTGLGNVKPKQTEADGSDLPRWLMSEDVRDKVRVTPLPLRLS